MPHPCPGVPVSTLFIRAPTRLVSAIGSTVFGHELGLHIGSVLDDSGKSRDYTAKSVETVEVGIKEKGRLTVTCVNLVDRFYIFLLSG